MDVSNSVVTGGGRGTKGLNGNGKNTIKIKSRKKKKKRKKHAQMMNRKAPGKKDK